MYVPSHLSFEHFPLEKSRERSGKQSWLKARKERKGKGKKKRSGHFRQTGGARPEKKNA